MKYQNILQDIQTINSPVGEPDEESKLYVAIDEQVIKFGSLQHDTIDWTLLINSSMQYLTEVCKDYKVLQYFSYALLQQNANANLADFLALFAEFNEKYLFNAYPKPSQDNVINRFKARAITLILNRIEDAVLNKSIILSPEQNQATQDLLQKLSAQLSDYISESAVIFNKVLRKLTSEKSQELKPEEPSNHVQPSIITSTGKNAIAEKANLPDVSSFDLTNERKLKQFYLQVADTTCELDPAAELGYISRRYGLWHNITRLPEMNAQGVTPMQSIAVDKLMDYREAVIHTPDTTLLAKIEKTVVSSPYWIEGSYLSAQCCKALKFNEASDAIRNITKQFVEKHKDFAAAKFQNGEPFLPQNVINWLAQENTIGFNDSSQLNDFDDIYQTQGFVAVLRAIDEKLKQSSDLRTRSYLQLDKIHYFIAEGITNMALNELDELLENSKKYDIEQWDNSFFTQLNQLKIQLT
ncbi:type VI secretion system protein TssA [Cricetibacter osteomyelitidis]|nr:type VI secretion system protein TssA [Cricetibacter osteomyelitidis]